MFIVVREKWSGENHLHSDELCACSEHIPPFPPFPPSPPPLQRFLSTVATEQRHAQWIQWCKYTITEVRACTIIRNENTSGSLRITGLVATIMLPSSEWIEIISLGERAWLFHHHDGFLRLNYWIANSYSLYQLFLKYIFLRFLLISLASSTLKLTCTTFTNRTWIGLMWNIPYNSVEKMNGNENVAGSITLRIDSAI